MRPTSSAVRSRSVSSRQLATSRPASKTPSVMLVLPTSRANNIGLGDRVTDFRYLTSDQALHRCSNTNQQRAVVIHAHRRPFAAAVGTAPRHEDSDALRRAPPPRVEDSIEAAVEQISVTRRDRA